MATPYLLFQRYGDEELLTLMVRQVVIMKVRSAREGLLALFGLYYMAMMPYPPGCNIAMLYVQHAVLGDDVHEQDTPFLKHACQMLEAIAKENGGFDPFA
jgi:hypothetical protein